MKKHNVIVKLSCLNAIDIAGYLYFSVTKYIDDDGHSYEPRISKKPLIGVFADDGGLLNAFADASIGDIELTNTDGGLDYLVDYAFAGRDAIIKENYNGVVSDVMTATIASVVVKSDSVIVTLKAKQSALSNPHPNNTFAGNNTLPAGLEGLEDDIKGKVKPRVYGDVRNIQATLVNSALGIYQASDRTDTIITAVYDNGVRLAFCRTTGTHSIGATTINVSCDGDIATGSKVMFSNHDTVYSVTTGLSANTIVISPGLTKAVGQRAALELINFYADADALQLTDYFVDGDHSQGAIEIAVAAGVGAITAGMQVAFSGHVAIYTVATDLTSGSFTITSGLEEDLEDGEVVNIIGADNPMLWGGWQGYFRLTGKPAGTITCDAMTVDGSFAALSAGDSLALIADEASLSVDDVSVFNAAGKVGIHFAETITTKELFDRVTRSVGGYYWFVNSVCYTRLLDVPGSVDWSINDDDIIDLEPEANGLGNNGLPIYQVVCQFDRIETVQPTTAGDVGNAWQQRLKSQTRELKLTNSGTLTRHSLSESLTIQSYLRSRSDANTVATRIFDLVKTRCDVIVLTMPIELMPSFALGAMITVTTPRFTYESGRDFILIGYTLDDHIAKLRLIG